MNKKRLRDGHSKGVTPRNPFSDPHQNQKKKKQRSKHKDHTQSNHSQSKRSHLSAELSQVLGNKRNTFADKRYSRHFNLDEGLIENLRVERFHKERQKLSKQMPRFHLGDEEDDKLSGMLSINSTTDQHHSRYVTQEQEEDELTNDNPVDQFQVNPNRPKTKQEVLREVIMKSKYHKMERQELQEKQQEKLLELDVGMGDIRSLMQFRSNLHPEAAEEHTIQISAADEYDKKARQLNLDFKIQPSDRLTTKEEAALKSQRRVAELEKERLRRQLDSSSLPKTKQYTKPIRPTDDDLIEDWVVDESLTSAYMGNRDEFNSGMAFRVGDRSEEWNRDCEMENTTPFEDDSGVKISLGKLTSPPRTHKEFSDLFDDKNPQEQIFIYKQIREQYLKPEHKGETKEFFSFLLDRFRDICNSYADGAVETPVSDLNVLSDVLYRLSQDAPEAAAASFKSHLRTVQKTMRDIMGYQHVDESRTSDVHALMFLKVLGNVFSTSDFRHSLVTPCLLLLSQRLTHKAEGKDICTSLYICCLLLHYIRKSRRYVPEIILFFHQILTSPWFAEKRAQSTATWPTKLDATSSASSLSTSPSHLISKQNVLRFVVLGGDQFSDEFKSKLFQQLLISLTLDLISKCVDIYGNLQCFPQSFYSVEKALRELPAHSIMHCQELHCGLIEKIVALKSEVVATRKPLILQRTAVPVRQFTPKVDPDFDCKNRNSYPTSHQDEIRKLKQKLRKVKREAVRELRRDNAHVAVQQRRRAEEVSGERQQKQKEIRKMLDAQHQV